MDSQDNRNDRNNTRDVGMGEIGTARTVSFLREDRGLSVERMREYLASEKGKRTLIISLVVLAIVIFLVIAASMSLPGQPLYGVKTTVLEPAGTVFSLSEEARAERHLKLMEERLEELKALNERGVVEEGAAAALSAHVSKNVANFVSITQGSEERTLDRMVVIRLTNNFAAVTQVMEDIGEDNESLLTFADTIAEQRREALRRLRDEVEVYVSLTDDAGVQEFLTDELNAVSERVDDEDVSEDTRTRIGRSIEDVAAALVANDAEAALDAALEARRLISLEEYWGDVAAL